MAIQTLHDKGSSFLITPKMDGGVYGTVVSDCVCKGIGDEFTMTFSTDSLQVSFAAGSQAVIGGAFFYIKSTETITLTPNATIYLCATINTSQPDGSKGSFQQRTSTNMKSDNLNGNGTIRDMLLYTIKTSGSGVSEVVDRRTIVGDGKATYADMTFVVTKDENGNTLSTPIQFQLVKKV